MWPLGFQGLGHMVRILGLRFRVLRYRLRFLRGFVGFRLSGVGGGGGRGSIRDVVWHCAARQR